jgi:chaperonin GroES
MAEDKDLKKGEFLELEDEESDVRDTDDGGAMVTLEDNEADRSFQAEHFANIVDDVEPALLKDIVGDLLDKIERDKDARAKRDKQYEEGIRRTGLGDDAPGGAQFTGANKVVHPMLTEACVDFSARAMKELFPPNGPVRTKILGEPSKEKSEKAERKADYMNWQLTQQMPEFRSDLEQLMTQLPLGGAQYLKLYYSHSLKRITSEFVPIDDVYLPFAASNYYSAERKTHVQYITEFEYQKRVSSGMYKDVDLGMPDDIEWSKATKANDKIEGREENSYNEDGLRTIFEITTYADLEGDEFDPYIISVDKATQQCLSVYRNWKPDDEARESLINMVEFPFIPWRGAYPIGLTHMIGGLSGSATGALRALMDSAHINNIPTMLKLKGGPNGQNLNPQPTEVVEIEGGVNVDDVRKIAMPIPFNPPSPVLFQLLGFLVDSGKGVVQTSFEKLSDQNPNQPVGTTLALIEQGMVVFSSIHARLHNAMGNVLKVVHRLNSAYLTEDQVFGETGEDMVRPDDFDGPMDVIPVSDPNIFSETQRFAQITAVQQRATMLPQLYDIRKVEEMFLKQLKIPDYEDLLVEKPEPEDIDPASENAAASMDRPIMVVPTQDHVAHLHVHMAFLQSPLFGQNPVIARTFLPKIITHLRDHIVQYYLQESHKAVKVATDNQIITKDNAEEEVAVINKVLQVIEQQMQSMTQIMPQLEQQISQMQGAGPQDPTMAVAQMANETQKEAIQQRAADAQVKNQLKTQELQQKAQISSQQSQLGMAEEQLRQDREDQRTMSEIQARVAMNTADNETAKELAAVEVASGERFSVSTGTGVNPNP